MRLTAELIRKRLEAHQRWQREEATRQGLEIIQEVRAYDHQAQQKSKKAIRRGRSPKRVTEYQRLVWEADAWVKAIVLQKQGPACLKCGQVKPLQAAHILPKGHYPRLRHELDNVIGLCLKDHLFWAHKSPLDFNDWLEQKFPGRIAKLRLANDMSRKQDLKELICVLKSMAESL